MAWRCPCGEVSEEAKRLIAVTRQSFYEGIKLAVAGKRVSDISHAVQTYVEANGFSVVRTYVGHGVGAELHESPEVPNFGRPGRGSHLVDGLVICIEPMINAGGRGVYLNRNGWAVHTADGAKSAHFELTVVVRRGKAEQLSTFDFIEKDSRINF